ncbi:uncharacterized protein METZ01_LOCUS331251, partial [marine metagenome]
PTRRYHTIGSYLAWAYCGYLVTVSPPD